MGKLGWVVFFWWGVLVERMDENVFFFGVVVYDCVGCFDDGCLWRRGESVVFGVFGFWIGGVGVVVYGGGLGVLVDYWFVC